MSDDTFPNRGRTAAEGVDGRSTATANEVSYFTQRTRGPASGLGNIAVAMKCPTRLDRAVAGAAVRELLRRHSNLRTVYSVNDEVVHKIVLRAEEIAEHSLERLAEVPTTPDDLPTALTDFAARPLPLAGGVLVRGALFTTRAGSCLCLVLHHLVFDMASMDVLVRDFVALYNEISGRTTTSRTPCPPMSSVPNVVDHAAESLPADERNVSFWRERLTGLRPESMRLRIGRSEPAHPTLAGAVIRGRLSQPSFAAARRMRRELRATENALCLATFYLLLDAHGAGHGADDGARDDLVVGTSLSTRTEREADSVGNLVSMVALRQRLDPSWSFRMLVQEVRTTMLDALDHVGTPIEELVRLLWGEPAMWRTTPFRHVFSYVPRMQSAKTSLRIDGVPVETVPVHNGQSRFDLEFMLIPQQTALGYVVVYNTEIHDREDVEDLVECYQSLLAALASAPDTPIGDLPLAPSAVEK